MMMVHTFRQSSTAVSHYKSLGINRLSSLSHLNSWILSTATFLIIVMVRTLRSKETSSSNVVCHQSLSGVCTVYF
jgi:hypothetical protein